MIGTGDNSNIEPILPVWTISFFSLSSYNCCFEGQFLKFLSSPETKVSLWALNHQHTWLCTAHQCVVGSPTFTKSVCTLTWKRKQHYLFQWCTQYSLKQKLSDSSHTASSSNITPCFENGNTLPLFNDFALGRFCLLYLNYSACERQHPKCGEFALSLAVTDEPSLERTAAA